MPNIFNIKKMKIFLYTDLQLFILKIKKYIKNN